MTRPTGKFLMVFAGWGVCALLPFVGDPRWWIVWIVGVSFLAAVWGIDALRCARRQAIDAIVDYPAELAVGTAGVVTVRLEARGISTPLGIDVTVDVDPLLEIEGAHSTTVTNDATATTAHRVRATRRGHAALGPVWLEWRGPLGLARKADTRFLDDVITITPDFGPVHATAIRFDRRTSRSGIKVERFVGDGSEFDALREFQAGFDHRAIDWKQSARHRALLCREFRAERNHHVVIALDVGHLMRETIDGVTRLDHAIASCLALSWACIKAGDQLSLFAFDEQVRLMMSAGRGAASFPRIRHALSGLEPSTGETNFTLALTDLSQRLRRRSLIVVLTEFVDTITAELMLENLHRLSRRHLVVFATFKDPDIDRIVSARPNSMLDVQSAVVGATMRRERTTVLERLTRFGIQCIEAPHRGLTTDLLNSYLEIKRREMV